MAEGDFPKSDGDVFFASEANNLHDVIKEIYTGSGFNSSRSGSGTDSQDHELTAQGSTDRDYVKILITGTCRSTETNGIAMVNLKAQIKETSGSYGDIIAYKKVLEAQGSSTSTVYATFTYTIYATLTSGQKTNGYQIKVFSQSMGNDPTSNSSFTNVQTVVAEC